MSDPLGGVATVASTVYLLVQSLRQLGQPGLPSSEPVQAIIDDVADYGLVRGLWLQTVFSQSRAVTRRIRHHVLVHPEKLEQAREAWSLKESYGTSLNLVAVAGAIIAQVAITALSLPDLADIHWIVESTFVTSLVSGGLSVYFACITQIALSNLHNHIQALDWLTTARGRPSRWTRSRMTSTTTEKMAAYSSALLLTLPAYFLNWAIITLLIGIGCYYGLIWHKDIGDLQGTDANLGIFVVYIVFTGSSLCLFLIPLLSKEVSPSETTRIPRPKRPDDTDNLESGQSRDDKSNGSKNASRETPVVEITRQARDERRLEYLRSHFSREFPTAGIEHTDALLVSVREALEASISAQKANLDAQVAFLQLIQGTPKQV